MNGIDGDAGHGAIGVNGTSTASKMLWKHPAPMSTPMFKFMENVNQKYGLQLSSYEELHRWSVDNIGKFWGRVWGFVGVRAEEQASRVCSIRLCGYS